MNHLLYNYFTNPLPSSLRIGIGILFVLLILWSLVWKGIALWKAARQDDQVWFVILLVINTIGILDILYIYFFSKKKNSY